MLNRFDRDDLDKLWDLVKKKFSSIDPIIDKEKVLWVELKRLFKPDDDDTQWKLQRYMHDPLIWKLYNTCGVHHVSIERGHDIFMVVEKDYLLTRALMTVMLANKLEVDESLEMANELPKVDEKYHFELKGQFLKELRDNTFSGSGNEDANEHIKKVLEIVDLFHVPNITQDQIMLRVLPMPLIGAQDPDETLYQAWERFKELLMKCPQHYLTEMQEVILFYNGLDVPTRQILDSKGSIPTKIAADPKVAIQEMAKYSQKWHNGTSRIRSTKTSDGLAAIDAQLNNLGREIKKVNEKVYAAQVGCEQCKGPHYTKDYPLKEEGKALKEAYYTSFDAPFQQGGKYRAAALGFYQKNNANPSYQERRQSMEESLSKFMNESAKRHEENSNLIKEIRASTNAAIKNQGASIKTLEIQIRSYHRTMKHPKGIAENVLLGIGKFVYPSTYSKCVFN
ncbi:hypothetical protein Tco_0738276 [Tanacetum coccineum]